MTDDEERVQDALEGLTVQTGAATSGGLGPTVKKESDSAGSTPDQSKDSRTRSPSMSPDEHKPRSDSASTPDGGQAPKLSRKASQKMAPRPVTTFAELPDVTAESCSHFQVIPDCLYGSKSIGSSEHDALDCDCNEEWRRLPP